MAASVKPRPAPVLRATLTSKGQVTLPVQLRRSLGLKAGDKLRFEPSENGFRLVAEKDESPFEKWRGIGSFPGMGKGRQAVIDYMRELRGHDEYDDNLD